MASCIRRTAALTAVAGLTPILIPVLVMAWPTKVMSQATPSVRPPRSDRFFIADGRTMEIAATDSDYVLVTIEGGKYPLLAHSTAGAAQSWAARTESVARAARGAAAGPGQAEHASERNEFGHFSDILRYQHFDNSSGPRDVIAIDIGPRNVPLFEATVSPAILEKVTASMRHAAGVALSLPRSLPPSGVHAAAVRESRSSSTDGESSQASTLSPSKQCIVQSGLPPMPYTGPDGYAAGTSLDKLVQPPLRAGSPLPSYPSAAAGARVTGMVVARFVIDTAGRAVISTFRLVGGSNPLFVESVCKVLPAMRFVPSRVGGRPVAQVVEETFVIPPVPASR